MSDKSIYRKWLKIAKANGITYSAFKHRVKYAGWEYKKAATTPVKETKARKDQKWIETAKQNGIPYDTYVRRVDHLNWSPKEAATKSTESPHKKWVDIAVQNGIQPATYRNRVQRGWSPEKAATTPTMKPGEHIQRKRKDKDWIEIALKNGIPYHVYRSRVETLFWSPEEAATTQVLSSKEASERAVEMRAELKAIEDERAFKNQNNLFKLTPQHLEIAVKNGLSENLVKHRVYIAGWTVQEAITTPKKEPSFKAPEGYYEYLKLAKQNGISASAYRVRVKLGWALDEAATKPTMNLKGLRGPNKKWRELAIQNGINLGTFKARLKMGWSPEEAATIPALKKGEYLNDERRENAKEGFEKFRKKAKRR